jgi:thiosulfate/3-mercaptopyruvate sulfurtransferase
MSLVETNWVENNLSNIKLIDCSWHLPNASRNPYQEYLNQHLPNALFFDLDKNSDQNTELPHMLPSRKKWDEIVSNLGIKNEDRIIVYDNSDLISSCRLWYTFIYFGHNPKLVSILNGGFEKWQSERRPITKEVKVFPKSHYISKEKKDLVKSKKQIEQNIINQEFKILDARSKERFEGKEKEPRKGLRSGSIPNSLCLPFKQLIEKDKTFKSEEELLKIFKSVLKHDFSSKVVFSCGSGVTASVLALAYSLIDNKYNPVIYDGSWSEYGRI